MNDLNSPAKRRGVSDQIKTSYKTHLQNNNTKRQLKEGKGYKNMYQVLILEQIDFKVKCII